MLSQMVRRKPGKKWKIPAPLDQNNGTLAGRGAGPDEPPEGVSRAAQQDAPNAGRNREADPAVLGVAAFHLCGAAPQDGG